MPTPDGPADEGLLPCSCTLCRFEVWVSPGGGPPLDGLGLGSGYKMLLHDCDNPDVEAMLEDIWLIPGLIRPAGSIPPGAN